MNLQLVKTEEFINGQFAGMLGEVLIRCNNVLYIRAATDAGASAGTAMQEWLNCVFCRSDFRVSLD